MRSASFAGEDGRRDQLIERVLKVGPQLQGLA
jgi:hypothetical protein